MIRPLARTKPVNTHLRNREDGDVIKTTPSMIGRWVKASFLVVLGIIILVYADKFVQDLRSNADHFDVSFEWTWSLIKWLLWVLAAWLLVDAVLIIALSFSEQKHTLGDVIRRLDLIEKKLGVANLESTTEATGSVQEGPIDEASEVTESAAQEEPPPPA